MDQVLSPTQESDQAQSASSAPALMAALARGDLAAANWLLENYSQPVTALARRLLAWDDGAQDVAQEVFVAAVLHAGTFRGDSGLWTWLSQITVNECRKQMRHKWLWRRFLASPSARGQGVGGDHALPRLAGDEHADQVRRAVAALPPKLREAIVLHYLQEMPVSEVGQVLGLSETAVSVRLHRARQRLKGELRTLWEEK